MIKKYLNKLLLIFMVSTSPLCAKNLWSEMAIEDLNFIHQELMTNTPIPLDIQNPKHAEWLENGYKLAKKMAEKVEDFGGYKAVLNYYTFGFFDGHIGISFDINSRYILWPRFALSFQNGRFIISFVEEGNESGIKVGDEILSLDDESPKDFFLKFAPFNLLISNLESSWIRSTPSLLIDNGNPFISMPKKCVFRSEGGLKNIDLDWEKIESCHLQEIIKKILQRDVKRDFEVHDFMTGEAAWVSLPSFSIENQEDLVKIKSVLEKVKSLRDKKLIVIDLRDNSGGNSSWGTQLLKNLFGVDFVNMKLEELYAKEYVEFRISKDNLEYIKMHLKKSENQFGKGSELSLDLQKWVDKMEESIQSNHFDLMRIESKKYTGKQNILPAFNGTIFFMPKYSCASSCLTFSDELFSMPNVIQVGFPTAGGTPYTEVRLSQLPSKNGSLVLPMKVIRNSTRGSNEAYLPTYRFEGDDRDAKALEDWVIHLFSEIQKKK